MDLVQPVLYTFLTMNPTTGILATLALVTAILFAIMYANGAYDGQDLRNTLERADLIDVG